MQNELIPNELREWFDSEFNKKNLNEDFENTLQNLSMKRTIQTERAIFLLLCQSKIVEEYLIPAFISSQSDDTKIFILKQFLWIIQIPKCKCTFVDLLLRQSFVDILIQYFKLHGDQISRNQLDIIMQFLYILCSKIEDEPGYHRYRGRIFEIYVKSDLIIDLMVKNTTPTSGLKILILFSSSQKFGHLFCNYLCENDNCKLERLLFALEIEPNRVDLYILQNFSNNNTLEKQLGSNPHVIAVLMKLMEGTYIDFCLSAFATVVNISISESSSEEELLEVVESRLERNERLRALQPIRLSHLMEKFDHLASDLIDTTESWELYEVLKPISRLIRIESYRQALPSARCLPSLNKCIPLVMGKRKSSTIQYLFLCCYYYQKEIREDMLAMNKAYNFLNYYQVVFAMSSIRGPFGRLGRFSKLRLLPIELIRKIALAFAV